MTATNVECVLFNCRLCLTISISSCTFQDLRLTTEAGLTGGVSITDTTLDATNRAEAGDYVINDDGITFPSGARVLDGVTAIRPGATSLTSNANASALALYTTTNSTLNGVAI